MAEVFKIPSNQPTSVGVMLREEFLEPLGVSQIDLAKAMGVSRKTVNELCGNRRGVTADTAFLLSKALGTTPDFWLNLQYLNDMWVVRNDEMLAERLQRAHSLI